MNRTLCYGTAILLHLVVLGFFKVSIGQAAAKADREKLYVEVTLLAKPPPPPIPASEVREVDLGPKNLPGSRAAAPPVDDTPPPVAVISPVSSPSPPPPAPAVDPANTLPPTSAPPTLPTPEPNAPAQAEGPPSEYFHLPAASGIGRAFSSGPFSGRGGGGGGARQGGPSGHFYEVIYVPEKITWDDAQKYALAHGGYLATITSAAENNFVFSLVNDPKYWIDHNGNRPGPNGPWLGGTSFARGANGWTWVNNEGPFTFTAWLTQRAPDDNNSERHVLYFSGPPHLQPTWDDTGSSVKLPAFVVEYNSNPADSLPPTK